MNVWPFFWVVILCFLFMGVSLWFFCLLSAFDKSDEAAARGVFVNNQAQV